MILAWDQAPSFHRFRKDYIIASSNADYGFRFVAEYSNFKVSGHLEKQMTFQLQIQMAV